MKHWSVFLRAALAAVTGLCLWAGAAAKAESAVEYVMVPSPAMGRNIPVAFLGGGPQAVFLLDAFNAGDTVSNWVAAGNAMNTLAGKGISVVAPAGGAYSLYADWEQDRGRQWETFLSAELPAWLARTRVWHLAATRLSVRPKAVPLRLRWRYFIPTGFVTPDRCQDS